MTFFDELLSQIELASYASEKESATARDDEGAENWQAEDHADGFLQGLQTAALLYCTAYFPRAQLADARVQIDTAVKNGAARFELEAPSEVDSE